MFDLRAISALEASRRITAEVKQLVERLNFLCGTLAMDEFESLNTGGHITSCDTSRVLGLVQISEYAVGASTRLVIFETISLSAYSGTDFSFTHSSSARNLSHAAFLPASAVKEAITGLESMLTSAKQVRDALAALGK